MTAVTDGCEGSLDVVSGWTPHTRPPGVFLTAVGDLRHGDVEDNCVSLQAVERRMIMQLLLSRDEYEFLVELLQQTRRNLREEIHKTSYDFRMDLKKQERILESLLQKVELGGFVEAAA